MTVRIVQAGLGLWGRDWAANVLPVVDDIEIAAAADSDPQSLEQARSVGLLTATPTFAGLDQALREVPADAVLVTASIHAHGELVRTALNAGCHVLVEKPFVTDVAEARSLVNLAQENGLVLAVVQNYRFHAAAVLARRLISDRVLGDVRGVSIDFRRNHPNEPAVSEHPELDHSILVQIAIHHFDLMRWVLNREATTVYCDAWSDEVTETTESDALPVPTSAAATLRFEDDVVVTFRGTMRSTGDETPWSGFWRIECDDGDLFWFGDDWSMEGIRFDYDLRKPGSVELRPRGMPFQRQPIPATLEGRTLILDAFLSAIRAGTEPPTSGRDNLGSIAMMAAAQESWHTRRAVAVDQIASVVADRRR